METILNYIENNAIMLLIAGAALYLGLIANIRIDDHQKRKDHNGID